MNDAPQIILQSTSDFWNQISSSNKLLLLILVLLLIFWFVAYWLIQIYIYFKEKNEHKNFLFVTYDDSSLEKPDLGKEINILLTKLHRYLKGKILTFEVHKNSDFEGFIFSSNQITTLQFIKSEIDKIDGITSNINNKNKNNSIIVAKFKNSIQLQSSLRFGNFKTNEFQFIQQVSIQISALESCAIIVTIRPSNIKYKIRSKISKLSYQITKNSQKYSGTDLRINKEIKELEDKIRSDQYQVKISIFGNTNEDLELIFSNYNLLTDQNYFLSKTNSTSQTKARFLVKSNLLMNFVPTIFGSTLNVKELSQIINFSKLGNKTTIKNSLKNKEDQEIVTSFSQL